MSIEFRIESNLGAVLDEMDDKKERVLNTWGQFGESETAVRTPVDKGDLRESVTHEVRLNDNAVDIIAGGRGITKEVNYPYYVEFGTSKMKAQPFMQPAIQENTRKFEQIAESIWGSD